MSSTTTTITTSATSAHSHHQDEGDVSADPAAGFEDFSAGDVAVLVAVSVDGSVDVDVVSVRVGRSLGVNVREMLGRLLPPWHAADVSAITDSVRIMIARRADRADIRFPLR